MKYLKFVFITLPNLPFILILAFYVIYRIMSDTGMVEFSMADTKLTPEIKKYIKRMYPKPLLFSISAFFWIYFSMYFFIN